MKIFGILGLAHLNSAEARFLVKRRPCQQEYRFGEDHLGCCSCCSFLANWSPIRVVITMLRCSNVLCRSQTFYVESTGSFTRISLLSPRIFTISVSIRFIGFLATVPFPCLLLLDQFAYQFVATLDFAHLEYVIISVKCYVLATFTGCSTLLL